MLRGQRQWLARRPLADQLQPWLAHLASVVRQAGRADGAAAHMREAVVPAALMEMPPERMGVEDADVPAGVAGQLIA